MQEILLNSAKFHSQIAQEFRGIPYIARKILYSAGSRKTTSVDILTRNPPHPAGLSTEADHVPTKNLFVNFASCRTHTKTCSGRTGQF
jgi:hypothetical protein